MERYTIAYPIDGPDLTAVPNTALPVCPAQYVTVSELRADHSPVPQCSLPSTCLVHILSLFLILNTSSRLLLYSHTITFSYLKGLSCHGFYSSVSHHTVFTRSLNPSIAIFSEILCHSNTLIASSLPQA